MSQEIPRVRVRVAALLHDYTGGASLVEARGSTVGELLDDLDRQYPGLAFRIIDEQGRVRPHMCVFVGQERATGRDHALPSGVELTLVGALSGG